MRDRGDGYCTEQPPLLDFESRCRCRVLREVLGDRSPGTLPSS